MSRATMLSIHVSSAPTQATLGASLSVCSATTGLLLLRIPAAHLPLWVSSGPSPRPMKGLKQGHRSFRTLGEKNQTHTKGVCSQRCLQHAACAQTQPAAVHCLADWVDWCSAGSCQGSTGVDFATTRAIPSNPAVILPAATQQPRPSPSIPPR